MFLNDNLSLARQGKHRVTETSRKKKGTRWTILGLNIMRLLLWHRASPRFHTVSFNGTRSRVLKYKKGWHRDRKWLRFAVDERVVPIFPALWKAETARRRVDGGGWHRQTAIDGFAWSSRSGENRSVSANGLRRKTQLSRNQSLISHLVSVLRPCRGVASFVKYLPLFFIRPSSFRSTYSLYERKREREKRSCLRNFLVPLYSLLPLYCIKTRRCSPHQDVSSMDVPIFRLTTWLWIRCDHAALWSINGMNYGYTFYILCFHFSRWTCDCYYFTFCIVSIFPFDVKFLQRYHRRFFAFVSRTKPGPFAKIKGLRVR